MNLEASVMRFHGKLHKPASPDDFMSYDYDDRSRSPSNRHRGAFKSGWRAAQEVREHKRKSYRPATLRRLAWCNLGYRFVRWRDPEEQERCDQAEAYELFKRLMGPPPPPRGREKELDGARRLKYRVMTEQGAWLATKREAKLVHDYQSQLQGKHRELKSRWWGNFNCDAYEKARNNLIEAKASCKREDIRMAVGELFDYEFLLGKEFKNKKPNKAILLPHEPDPESVKWLGPLKIALVWKEKGVFLDNAKGQFS